MPSRLPAILLAQPLLWALLAAVALLYAVGRQVPPALALSLLPSFLIELALYFATASEALRDRLAALSRVRLAFALTLAALPSYLVYTTLTETFDLRSCLLLAALAGAASFWYVLCGSRPAADLGFLVWMALPVLLKVFDEIYPRPAPRIPMQTLGLIMWYRTGIIAVLVLRGFQGIGFGLLPGRSDWKVGFTQFLWFLPPGLVLAYTLEFIRPQPPEFTARLLLNAAATFIGTLWFLAVAEEFFFRGLLQQTLERLFQSRVAGLVAASLAFGAVHLGFREFPNWRFAILATVAGLFYGRAFLRAASIRAAMVTHALVVTLWRVFLS